MKLELISATLADYPIIQNMGRFYVYDMSEYMGSEAGWEMPSDGLYECIDFQHYWTDQDTFPFLVRANDELAGFVIVNKQGSEPEIEFNMAQFFILRKFKNKGIGKQTASECFARFPGVWEVRVMPGNTGAYHFWKAVISQYTKNNYTEYTRRIKTLNNEENDFFRFNSSSKTKSN
jgi:ribosomal-protein-alanine N-acetyltransferase